jgi:serine protease Do
MNRRDGVVQLSGRGAMALGVLLTIVFVTSGPALAQGRTDAARQLSKAFSDTAKSAMPAVVSIKVEKTVPADQMMGSGNPFEQFNDPFGGLNDDFLRRFFGGQMPQRQAPQKYVERGQGSGFIISPDGYILTNNHVVGDVDKITVELKDGRKFTDAKVIGTDPDTEVALIKIPGSDFPVLPMGDSDKIEIGDWVVAIGNPFGLSETVTVGVVSAKGRSDLHIANYESFIQTDAAINPGNSGGPLIDLDGRAIGINTAIYSQAGGYMGIGFAIPINMARAIEEQLKSGGKVVRGYLGLYGQNITPDMAELMGLKSPEGVVVAQVEPGSPADKGGLKGHDVIVEMNGKKVESYDRFRNEIAMMKPGNTVRLNILRDNKPMELTITLGERPSTTVQVEKQDAEPQQSLGITVQNLTKDLADQFKYPVGEGVIVSQVTPGGPAADQGIQAGDLILSVNGQKVNSVSEFADAVRQAKPKGKVLFLLKRGEGSQFVVVPFE